MKEKIIHGGQKRTKLKKKIRISRQQNQKFKCRKKYLSDKTKIKFYYKSFTKLKWNDLKKEVEKTKDIYLITTMTLQRKKDKHQFGKNNKNKGNRKITKQLLINRNKPK